MKNMLKFPYALALVLLFGLHASAQANPSLTKPAAPPNVVLILVDDMGWMDLSCQGSEYFLTPNIDRLAKEGMRFTDAYAACAVCSPTRAAVMTGKYPARTHVTDWIRARFQRGGKGTPKKNPKVFVGNQNNKLLCPPNPYWLDLEEVTLAEALKPKGYVSCHIGKWHLGDDPQYPGPQGFDENHGGCDYGQPPSYFDPYTNKRLPQGIPFLLPQKKGEYLTDREAKEAESFIRRNSDRPFFLYLAHYAVHTPIQAKKDVTEKYKKRKKTLQKRPDYAAMVESVDDAVGRVMKTLKETGVEDNTMIIFTSDNGGLLGPTHNAPLRSGKGNPYEGGIRVPLIVKWPKVVQPNSISNLPVTSVDYFPTILEAAKISLPKDRQIDGMSLVSHLKGAVSSSAQRDAIFWHFPHYRGRITPYSIIRQGDWKLLKWYEGPRYELYNLKDDLSEKTDLANEKKDLVKRLDQVLVKHLHSVGAAIPRENLTFKGRLQNQKAKTEGQPRVLILGDSISMGYTPLVKAILSDEAYVTRPRGNCQGTNHGVEQIEKWLALEGGKWDVIHFNFGLHDLKRVQPNNKKKNSNDPKHPRQAEPEIYRKQLQAIVKKLKATGAKLIFATTTPVPDGGVRPHRDITDPQRYNQIAHDVVKGQEVAITDLYSLSQKYAEEIQRPVDVHFTPTGSRLLAEEVARGIQKALK